MSGDTGWLIALCTDGHAGEKGRRGKLCSPSLSIRPPFSLSLPLFVLHCPPSRLLSDDPHFSPFLPLFVCCWLELWVALRDSPSWRRVDMTCINVIQYFHLFELYAMNCLNKPHTHTSCSFQLNLNVSAHTILSSSINSRLSICAIFDHEHTIYHFAPSHRQPCYTTAFGWWWKRVLNCIDSFSENLHCRFGTVLFEVVPIVQTD